MDTPGSEVVAVNRSSDGSKIIQGYRIFSVLIDNVLRLFKFDSKLFNSQCYALVGGGDQIRHRDDAFDGLLLENVSEAQLVIPLSGHVLLGLEFPCVGDAFVGNGREGFDLRDIAKDVLLVEI